MKIPNHMFTIIFNIINYRNNIVNLSFIETVVGKTMVKRKWDVYIYMYICRERARHKSCGMTKEPDKNLSGKV